MAHRIDNGVERGQPVDVTIDGRPHRAYAGETVATVLFAAGVNAFHRSRSGQARGPFCNMGACFDCLVRVGAAGEPISGSWVRACMTLVQGGMAIVTATSFGERALRRPESGP